MTKVSRHVLEKTIQGGTSCIQHIGISFPLPTVVWMTREGEQWKGVFDMLKTWRKEEG